MNVTRAACKLRFHKRIGNFRKCWKRKSWACDHAFCLFQLHGRIIIHPADQWQKASHDGLCSEGLRSCCLVLDEAVGPPQAGLSTPISTGSPEAHTTPPSGLSRNIPPKYQQAKEGHQCRNMGGCLLWNPAMRPAGPTQTGGSLPRFHETAISICSQMPTVHIFKHLLWEEGYDQGRVCCSLTVQPPCSRAGTRCKVPGTFLYTPGIPWCQRVRFGVDIFLPVPRMQRFLICSHIKSRRV